MINTENFLNHEVNSYFGGKRYVGKLFGLELELEGRGVGLDDVPTRGWGRHKEPSLRGESIEYTFSTPKTLESSKKHVEELFAKFKDNGVKLNDSVRTSTHVHLNFSDQKIKKAINFFSLFTVLEELLTYYSGEDRSGNLFCISSRDAEGVLGVLRSDLSQGHLQGFMGDRLKYAACNLCTLYKFNTIEVRTMRGAESAEMVNEWLDILNEMYEYSLNMESPAQLPNQLSMFGANLFLSRIFSEKSKAALLKTFPRIRDLHDSLMEGARLIQLFAYELDDAFKVEKTVEVRKGGKLRYTDPNNRMVPSVYLPNSLRWNCFHQDYIQNPEGFWKHGDTCSDDRRVIWDEDVGRFYVVYPNEGKVYLRWARHPELGNEGGPRPLERRPMPADPLDDIEEMIDDEEAMEDDE